MDKKNPPLKVTLFRHGQLLDIVPPVDALYSQFCTVRHEAKATTEKGFLIEPTEQSLIWPDKDQVGNAYLQTFAGNEPKVTAILQRRGIPTKRTGRRPRSLGEPKWANLPRYLTGDRLWIRFVQQHERGIIWYRQSDIQVPWLIAQIAFSWPARRILVLVTRKEEAKAIHGLLRSLRIYASLATSQHYPRKAQAVTVCTFSGLKQLGVQLHKRTICICLDPPEVFQKPDWLPHYGGRLYGLLPEDLWLPKFQADHVEALFGTESLFLPRHGFRDLPVNVVFWDYGDRGLKPRFRERATAFNLKQQLVWQNQKRNRLIAGLASTIANEDQQALADRFPKVAPHLYHCVGRRVAVLVENLDHAVALANHLPDWPIVARHESVLPAEVDQSAAAGDQLNQALAAGREPSSQWRDVIVTTSALDRLGKPDVIIRADAGVTLPPIPSTFFIASDGVSRSLTLIDVGDNNHAVMRRRANWRRNTYRKRGWNLVRHGGGLDIKNEDQFHHPPTVDHQDRRKLRTTAYVSLGKWYKGKHTALIAYQSRAKRRRRKAEAEQTCVTLRQIADHEFLLDCFKHLRRHGGKGTGLDRIGYDSLSMTEWAAILRKLSKALLKRRYLPQVPRRVLIDKPGTDEKRILNLGSICDRVVALALHRKLEPHFDKLFLNGVWGFRPDRGILGMLSAIKKAMRETGRFVVVVQDIRKAFDNIPVEVLVAAHHHAQSDLTSNETQQRVKINDSVLKLIAQIARSTDQQRLVGIDQGSNYSPTALNLVLHYVHDLPLSAAVTNPYWYRYADNLVYLCQDETEGKQILHQASTLLEQAKLELKDTEGGVFDLRKHSVDLLGFRLRKEQDDLKIRLGKEAWKGLDAQLTDVHECADPQKVAQEVIVGWVNAFGAAFENVETSVTEVLRTASKRGFQEMDRKLVQDVAQVAKERWGTM